MLSDVLPAYPERRSIDRVLYLQDSVKWDDRFLNLGAFLQREIGFAEPSNHRGPYFLLVTRRSSVAIGDQVVFWFFLLVPAKSVQNILEWVNHGFHQCSVVTKFHCK